MKKKIILIPDVHGRDFWRKIFIMEGKSIKEWHYETN